MPNDSCLTVPYLGYQCYSLTQGSITSIDNLPAGMTYKCENEDCKFSKDPGSKTSTCLAFEGTPSVAGVTTITVNVELDVQGIDVPYSFDIDVTVNDVGEGDCEEVVVEDPNEGETETSVSPTLDTKGITTSPNPTTGFVTFSKELSNGVLLDVLGNELFVFDVSSSIDLSNQPAGIYILKSDQGMAKITKE